jgi:hypothetical protein
VVALGEALHPEPGALATRDREDRHQQHPTLRDEDRRRMRQPGRALRKLIKSVSTAGLWSVGVARIKRGTRPDGFGVGVSKLSWLHAHPIN